MSINVLEDLFIHHLNQSYMAGMDISTSLPSLILSASDVTLKKFLTQYINDNDRYLRRLENVFAYIKCSLKLSEEKSSLDFKSLTGHVHEMNSEQGIRDMAIITSVLRMIDFEISNYRILSAVAHHLGWSNVREALKLTLDSQINLSETMGQLAEVGCFQKNGLHGLENVGV